MALKAHPPQGPGPFRPPNAPSNEADFFSVIFYKQKNILYEAKRFGQNCLNYGDPKK